MPRAAGSESERAELRRPHSCATCTICSEKNFLEKALTISGVDRFTRPGGTCRLHAIFMNQLCIIWGISRNCQARQFMERRTRCEHLLSTAPQAERTLRRRADGLLGADFVAKVVFQR